MPYFIIPADNCAFLTCEDNYSLDEVTTAWREVQEVLAEREPACNALAFRLVKRWNWHGTVTCA